MPHVLYLDTDGGGLSPVESPRDGLRPLAGRIIKTEIDGVYVEFTSEWRSPPDADLNDFAEHFYRLIAYGDLGDRFDHPFEGRPIRWLRTSTNARGISEYDGEPLGPVEGF